MPTILNPTPAYLLALMVAYLCGSAPFGYLVGAAHGVDVRTVGSRNIGATNVGRVLGRRFFYLVFALDAAKGFIPVAVAGWWLNTLGDGDTPPWRSWSHLAVGVAALLGHLYPVWLSFRGGKGVATGFGVLVGVFPTLTLPVVGATLVWVAVYRVWRFVSLASIVAALSVPLLTLLSGAMMRGADLIRPGWGRGTLFHWYYIWPYLIFTGIMAGLVVFRHRANIRRLVAGTELRSTAEPSPPPYPPPPPHALRHRR